MTTKRVTAWLVAMLVVLAGLAGVAPAQAAGVDWIMAPSGEMVKVGKPGKGVKAYKGKPGKARGSNLRTLLNPPYYFYAVGGQGFSAAPYPTGAYINIKAAKPTLAAGDYHTLAEIGVESSNQQQTVEIGWTVDRLVNGGSDDPHLFVGHWVDDVWQGYNSGCVDNASNSLDAGDNVNSWVGTAAQKYGAEYFGGNWWVMANNTWVCYFPGGNWSGANEAFTDMKLFQAFGEVTAAVATPTGTQMGNGTCGSVGTSAATWFASASYTAGPTVGLSLSQTHPTYYDTAPSGSTGRSFFFGGTPAVC